MINNKNLINFDILFSLKTIFVLMYLNVLLHQFVGKSFLNSSFFIVSFTSLLLLLFNLKKNLFIDFIKDKRLRVFIIGFFYIVVNIFLFKSENPDYLKYIFNSYGFLCNVILLWVVLKLLGYKYFLQTLFYCSIIVIFLLTPYFISKFLDKFRVGIEYSGNKNFISAYVVFYVLFLFFFIEKFGFKYHKIKPYLNLFKLSVYVLTFAVLISIFLYTQSRSTITALAIVSLLHFIIKKKINFLIIFSLAFVSFLIILNYVDTLTYYDIDFLSRGDSHRLDIWISSIQRLNTYSCSIFFGCHDEGLIAGRFGHSHSIFLAAIYNYGFIFIIFFILLFWQLKKKFIKEDNQYLLLLLVFGFLSCLPTTGGVFYTKFSSPFLYCIVPLFLYLFAEDDLF